LVRVQPGELPKSLHGYTTIALSSEDGERHVVLCASGGFASEEAEEAFFVAAGRLVWHVYCMWLPVRRQRPIQPGEFRQFASCVVLRFSVGQMRH
jgi:hypothetical protein